MSKQSSSSSLIQWDLFLTGINVFVSTLLVIFSPLASWLDPLRLVVGLPFVLFLPGYWLINALIPTREVLDGVERLGLSLGLSVAWIPILALILDWLPWGLQLMPILLGEMIIILIFMGIAFLRRNRLASGIAYVPKLFRPRIWWHAQSQTEQRMFIVVLSVLGIALIALTSVFLVPSPTEFMTEFYILGPDGLAENYVREASVGEQLTVTMGISNREKKDHSYYVEVWVVDPFDDQKRDQTGGISPFTLPKDKTVEFPINWTMVSTGDDQIVEFLLYIEDKPEPYRKLRLWLNEVP